MIVGVLVAAPFLSALLFPYPFTVVLMFVAALVFPPSGLLAGVFVDALYFTPEASLIPLGSAVGVCACLLGLLVRRFVKARIIDA